MDDNRKLYLTVTPFFPTEDNFRGSFVYDQVKAIERDGRYRVEVFRPKSRGDRTVSYDVSGIKVHLFEMYQMPSYFFNGLSNGHNGRLFVDGVRRAGIEPSQVAVCHCHTSVFGALGLALKKYNGDMIVAVQHHDLDPYTIRNGKLAGWYPNLYYRARAARSVFEKVDLHICVSKAAERNLRLFPGQSEGIDYAPYTDKLRRLGNFRPAEISRSTVLYNGVDTSVFNPEGRKRNHSAFRIGCIGNFQELKGQGILLEALEILSSRRVAFEAEFIGTGPERAACERYVSENGLAGKVRFSSEVPHGALADFYRGIDLFVLPSVFEGFGCVYTESWACGTPFIACTGQGASEYIYDEDASKWLVRHNDASDLADKIESYINNPQPQRVRYPVDIDVLVKEYLDQL